MSDNIKHFYEFAGFRLDPENPSLWRNDELVSISPKALETLILLVGKKGGIVSRDDLLEKVWKETFVEEGNINYTISLLRKTLGQKDLIQTVARHGYRLTATVKEISQNDELFAEISSHQSEPLAGQHRPRWILVSLFLVSLLFLTSFALFWRGDKKSDSPKVSQSENAEAMQAYTRGKMILEKKSTDNREEKAIDEFQKAITLDPTFALAYAGLAEGFASTAAKIPPSKRLDIYAKAKTAAEKALALEANLAAGFVIRGFIKRNADWDFAGAETDLRRAIELDPNSARAHQRLAQTLSMVGKHDEALAEINIAYQLDPVSDLILGSRFPILEARGEYTQALQEAEQVFRENKENNFAVRAFATFLYHNRDFAKVIELGEAALVKDPARNEFAWLSLLAAAYQKIGQSEKADENLRKLEKLSQTDTKAMYSLAMNYAELDRTDHAILALQKCFEIHEERMIWLRFEPRFANLRNDPRFLELIQKMRLNG